MEVHVPQLEATSLEYTLCIKPPSVFITLSCAGQACNPPYQLQLPSLILVPLALVQAKALELVNNPTFDTEEKAVVHPTDSDVQKLGVHKKEHFGLDTLRFTSEWLIPCL